jgi:GT2 family glycosyltransferase
MPNKVEEINPLVTVNILSFNRKEELRITLTKVYEQDYKNIEVIVVDNASTDRTQQMVKEEFPTVILIELQENIGIAGWNRGFEIAKGEYVVVLDDDAYPEKNAVKLVVSDFISFPKHGAIAFNVNNVYENNIIQPFGHGWVPARTDDDLEWSLVLGCAFAIRRSLYISDLFALKYFINFHELAIVLQIFRKGYLIKYSNNVIAYHINQINGKYKKERECIHFRNMINFIFYHFSKPHNIVMLSRVLLYYFTRSIRKMWFKCYLDSIISLKEPFISFTKDRLPNYVTSRIIDTGVIDYKFSSKITNLYEKK